MKRAQSRKAGMIAGCDQLPSWELDWPPVSWLAGLGELELRPISQHRMHDDPEAARQSDSRFAHR